MRRYTELYTYDEVGNILRIEHDAQSSPSADWTRGYAYATDGNRLLSNSVPGDDPDDSGTYSATYTYDDHGNMLSMPHLGAIDWDHADRMQHADLGGGGDVWFVYDGAGGRVRKVWVNQNGTLTRERIYLGDYEVWREHSGSPEAVQEERETLHVADDTGRVALVETLTVDGGVEVTSPANVARYQYGNQLGTVALELDDAANVISYEEYAPYGSSTYRAVDSGIEVSAKRYRYIGKERDEETGLDHMGARYYAPWLGRWTAADPIGLGDGVNRYAYVHGNPVGLVDPSGMAAGNPESFNPAEYNLPYEEDIRAAISEAKASGAGQEELDILQSLLQVPVQPEEATPSAPANDVLAVDRPSNADVAAARKAEVVRGQIQSGKAEPPGLPEGAAAVHEGGVVVGFVGAKPGTGGDVQQVFSIAGEPAGEFARGIEKDFTIEMAALDLLALKGLVGLGRAAFVAALERRAAQRAIQHESRRFAAEGAVGLTEGSTPGAFADALIEAQARVEASAATTEGGAGLSASAASSGIARMAPGSLPVAEEATLRQTLTHIDAGTTPTGALSKRWGTQFKNWAGDLPGAKGASSPYLEYRVAPAAGTGGAGARRVVVNKQTGEAYYTWTHYGDTGTPAFVQIR